MRGPHRLETRDHAGIDLMSGQIFRDVKSSSWPRQRCGKKSRSGGFITAPGVFELISALIADRMGFKALYVTGYGTVASALGLPDAGLASYSQMIDRIGRIVEMTKTPDHRRRRYRLRRAAQCPPYGARLREGRRHRDPDRGPGVSEKMRPHADRRVIPDCRHGAQDPRGVGQPLELRFPHCRAHRRADRAWAWTRPSGVALPMREAGADIIFIESPESEEELAECGRRINKPLLANMVNGGRTPVLPSEKLKAHGLFDCDLSGGRISVGRRGVAQSLRGLAEERHHNECRADVFVRGVQQADRLRRRMGIRAPLRRIRIGWQASADCHT